MRSLVFKFDKVTSSGALLCPLPLCHALAEGERRSGEERRGEEGALCTVATGHCCRTDELSDNN